MFTLLSRHLYTAESALKPVSIIYYSVRVYNFSKLGYTQQKVLIGTGFEHDFDIANRVWCKAESRRQQSIPHERLREAEVTADVSRVKGQRGR